MMSYFKEDFHAKVSSAELDICVEDAHLDIEAFAKYSNGEIDKSDFHRELLTNADLYLEMGVEIARLHALLDDIAKRPLGRIMINTSIKNIEA